MTQSTYENWLGQFPDLSFADTYDLYKSIECKERRGLFSITILTNNENAYAIVSCSKLAEVLILETQAHANELMDYLENLYANALGMDSEFTYRRLMGQLL